MSTPDRFDDLLNDWLEEGPESAPRDDLAVVLGEFPRIRQRFGIGPWRRPMPTLARVAVAAVLAIAVGAVVLTQIIQPSGPPVGAEPAPGWTDRFPTQTASAFFRPFTYSIDPTSGLELSPDRPSDIRRYMFRIAPAKDPESTGPTVVVDYPAEGIRLDPCKPEGSPVNPRPTAQEFVTYMATLPRLKVTPLEPSIIDGRTAYGIDVQRQPDPTCSELVIFPMDGNWVCCWPTDPTTVRRIWAIDVDGALVLVTIPYNSTNKEAQLEVANAFIDTFRFVGPGASPTPSN